MKPTETPLMRQYRQIKSRHPDKILLFRLGDFYETFGDDAVETAKTCGITLTKRNNGSAGDIPLAGFPHHQLDAYLPKLVRGGHRVAVCEQLEDPKQAKGIVRRDVVEVVTPGVVMYDKLLEANANTFIASLTAPRNNGPTCGIAFADVSTGSLSAGDIPIARIADVLESLQPAELIVNKDERLFWEPIVSSLPTPPSLTRLESWLFETEFTTTTLTRHFATSSLKGFGVDNLQRGLAAAGVLLHYVGESQKSALGQITSMHAYHVDDVMMLDAATRRNLEIHQSQHGNHKQGALVELFDATHTPMGGRMLRSWMQAPLLRADDINARIHAVRGLVQGRNVLDELRASLRGMGDVERVLTKVVTDRANARDLVSLRSDIRRIPTVHQTCIASSDPIIQALVGGIHNHADVLDVLDRALLDDPSLHVGSGSMFRHGYDATIDELTDAHVNGKKWIENYQDEERSATGIPSLKIGHTGVFGHYIEVTNTHRQRVPDRFERKQTLVNAERYTTSRLRELEVTLSNAHRELTEKESEKLSELRRIVSGYCVQLQLSTRTIATIDCLSSFATIAIERDYCEPVLHEGSELIIKQARHPVIERALPAGERYTPNDVHLDTAGVQMQLITGPNMSGKSSYLRQVGLITFLAHVGSFVPATSARIPLTDRIFTRVGAQDNVLAGESTFLVEMQESANILNNATQRSLILLDEVGRGTATFDGMSIAWAIAEYIHNVIGAKTLFATHYHELAAMSEQFPRIANMQVEVQEVNETILFTHRVVPGHSDHSFGIHVAKMAGLPRSVVRSATNVLTQLETGQRVSSSEDRQISLFEVRDDAIRHNIQKLDIDNMTPLQALQALTELKGALDG